MVDETLKAYLKQKLVERAMLSDSDAQAGLDLLFMYTEQDHAFSDAERDTLIKAIDTLKILDPACGSGAFPMGILHKLVYILHKLDPGNELWKERQLSKARTLDDAGIRERAVEDIEQAFANNELDYGRKLYLIENCVFGVDIQPIAVQIAKLRFFISLVIDQNKKPDKDNQGIRSLPNLETKFVAADSLITLKKTEGRLLRNLEIDRLEEALKALRHTYFSARSRKEKLAAQVKDKKLRQEIATLLEADGMAHRDASLVAAIDPYDQNASAPFFDPEWMFGVKRGFDIVIGNPPYVQIQDFSGKIEQIRWEAQAYKTYARMGDIYCLFYERGFQLLAATGTLCYITSNKWMRAGYGKGMRKFFLGNGTLQSLVDFGDSRIFENATTYTNILLWSGKDTKREVVAAYDLSRSYEAEVSLPAMLAKQGAGEALFTEESFVIATGAQAEVKKRIEAVGRPLKDWDIQIYRGILTGLNEAFIIDQGRYDELVAADPKSAEILKPILRGRDIKRYKAEWAGLYLVATYPALKLDIEKYPAVRDYLKSFGKAIEQTGEKGPRGESLIRKKTSNKWFETQDTIDYWEEFGKEKIIYPNMTKYSPFLYDRTQTFTNQKCFVVTTNTESLRFLTAVLNSWVFDFAFRKYFPELLDNTVELSKIFFERLPIPRISPGLQKPYEVLVDSIQFARSHALAAEADVLEAVVDVMVFGLYFEPEMKANRCYINDRMASAVETDIQPFLAVDTDEFKAAAVKKLVEFCQIDAATAHGLTELQRL